MTKTSPDTVQCPSGTKLLPVAPLAASRFYVRGVFIENTWQEGLWAKRWGYDSEEGKCSSVFMELPSGGERKSPGRSQGSSGPITLRTCKPWKDPVISQYIVLSWPVAPSDKWGKWAFPLGDRELLQHRLIRSWRNEEWSIKWAPEQNKIIFSAYISSTFGVMIWAFLKICFFLATIPMSKNVIRESQIWCLMLSLLLLDFLLQSNFLL